MMHPAHCVILDKRAAHRVPEPPQELGADAGSMSRGCSAPCRVTTTLPAMRVVGTTATSAQSEPALVVSSNETGITGLSGVSWVRTMPAALHMAVSKQTTPKDSITDENFRRDYPTQKYRLLNHKWDCLKIVYLIIYLSTHINDLFSKCESAVIITKDVEAWLGAFGAVSVGFSSIKQSVEVRQDFREYFQSVLYQCAMVFYILQKHNSSA